MKQFYLLLAVGVLSLTTSLNAQNTVTVDASAMQNGFANVFETPANGGAYVFGQGWGVPDIKTVVDAGANTLTLQPNFNTYADNPTDPFWVDQTTLLGNKVFEGNTFEENPALVGSALTFEGNVVSNTIDAGYVARAFIKVFNADFSIVKEEFVPLTGATFSVVYTNVEPADAVVQYGFQVTGINANPADEAALGNVVVTNSSLGVNDINTINVAVFPNPTANNVNIQSDEQLKSVVVYNVLGQVVKNATPNATNFSLEMSNVDGGMYFVTVTTETGSKTVKLIKK